MIGGCADDVCKDCDDRMNASKEFPKKVWGMEGEVEDGVQMCVLSDHENRWQHRKSS